MGQFWLPIDTLINKSNRYLVEGKSCYKKCFIYVSLPDKIFVLTGYIPTGSGVDVEKRSINFGRGTDLRDKNIYIFENENSQVSTLIECSNTFHAATRCQQFFNLNPLMKGHVRITYRKGLLPHWKEIQQSVTALINSFKVNSKDLNNTTNRN